MNNQETNTNSETIDIEYTARDIKEMRDDGIPDDELPNAGVHQFRRSKFVTRRSEQKIKVAIYLDADILDFLRSRENETDLDSYQKQINDELRNLMNRENQLPADVVTLKMLENPHFLATLAEKLKKVA